MSDDPNDWSWWIDALDGKRGELTRGEPKSGYFLKFNREGPSPVAIWRDESGKLWCIAGRWAPTDPDIIDELFGWCSRYPIPFEVYEKAVAGQPLPPECHRELTIKQIHAGEAWTIEKARAWLAADKPAADRKAAREALAADKAARAEAAAIVDADAADNPRAVVGGNAPPEPIAAEEAMSARLTALEQAAAKWLAEIGGKPRNQTEADIAANYGAKFLEIETEAAAAHKVEKEPFLEGGRRVDRKWFPTRDGAELLKKQISALAKDWVTAEKARLVELARQETARIERERAAARPDVAPSPIAPVVPPKVSAGTVGRAITDKERPAYVITDWQSVAVYLVTLNGTGDDELKALIQKLVNRLGRAGVTVPGVNGSQGQKAA